MTPSPNIERHTKRLRGTPTGTTPQQTGKRKKEGRGRKRLEYSSLEQPLANLHIASDRSIYVPLNAWSTEETKALVEFMLFHSPRKWSCTKEDNFWKSAATFVQDRAQRPQARTGKFSTFK